MRVSTKRILSIGASLLLFIGAIIVYANLIIPEVGTITQVRNEVASKGALFQNQSEAVTQVQNLIAQFKNLASLQTTVSLAMPNGQETIGALRQVEATAASAGATLTSLAFKQVFSTQPPTQPFIRQIETFEITLAAQGTYPQLKQFLQLLETSVRVANVTDLKFQPGVGKNADTTNLLSLTVDVYYQDAQ